LKVVWTEKARESLFNIYNFIYEKSPQNAMMVLDELISLGNSLNDPKLEYSKDLIVNDESIRFVVKWSYKIVYERALDQVVIIDVFNSKQNPDKLLKLLDN
jgi:toxin ParE1/3/4